MQPYSRFRMSSFPVPYSAFSKENDALSQRPFARRLVTGAPARNIFARLDAI